MVAAWVGGVAVTPPTGVVMEGLAVEVVVVVVHSGIPFSQGSGTEPR